MRRFERILFLLLAVSLAISVAACRKSESSAASGPASQTTAGEPPLAPGVVPSPAANIRVTEIQLGKSVGPDKKISTPAETFAPTDTIFVSVLTDGTAAATLHTKWTYQDGQTVKEDSKTISPTGPAATEFSIQKANGWPKGDYKVEVSVNDQPATSKSFKVK
ncbi:MAG TPA: hypothetical protein VIZ69_04155 [Thermoanaerobaculia bacterium]